MTHEMSAVMWQQNILSLNFVSRTANIKKYRTIIFPVVLNGCEKLISHTKGGAQAVAVRE
jgi:hypothetical protein